VARNPENTVFDAKRLIEHPGLRANYKIDRILASATTKFQTVDLVNLECFGRSLVIDGLMQSCRVDEFVYHECLVHPALLLHPTGTKTVDVPFARKNIHGYNDHGFSGRIVFIGGGGEGSTAREILRHKSVEKCVMVDIGREVVKFYREHLEENHEAFNDPRLEVVIDDAKAWIENSDLKFDAIFMDLDDPLEGGPVIQLHTVEFYTFLKSRLNPGKTSMVIMTTDFRR
jgi:spermidine synthase